jgi:hypothetical protein
LISTLKRAQDAAHKLVVKSALNPLLWLNAISVPTLIVSALLFDRSEGLRHFCSSLVYVAVAIPIGTLCVAIGFAIFKPDKLQSEEYQLKQQALVILEQMGVAPLLVDPQNIVAIANPAAQQPIASGSEAQ